MIRLLASFFVLSFTALGGVPTMGLAGSNADYKPMPGEGPQDVLRRALMVNGTVHVLPGTYQFTDELAGTFNNVRITGTHGAVFKPVASGTNGLFDFTGNDIIIDGIKVLVDTWTNDQTVIEFNGDNVHVTHCLFDVTTSSGTTANPMTLVYFENCYERDFTFNTVHPNKGVRVIYDLNTPNTIAGATGVDASNGLKVIGNSFSTNDGNLSEAMRQCYRVIDSYGGEFGIIQGNRFWQLGSKAAEVDSAIFIRKHAQLDGLDLLESGHWSITGNVIERVASPTCIKIWGAGNVQITGNMIGLPALLADADGTPNDAGEAAIVVTGADGTRTGFAAYNPTIVGNDIHNAADGGTDGAYIYLGGVDGALVAGNQLSICSSNQAIRVDGNDAERVVISGNSIQANSAITNAIKIIDNDAGAGSSMNGLFIGNNAFDNFTTPISVAAFFTGASGRRLITSGIQDTGDKNDAVVSVTSTGIAAADADTITDSNNGLGFLAAGDVIAITGFTGAGIIASNCVCTVKTVAAGTIDIQGAVLTADAAGESVTIKRVVTRATTNVTLSG